MSAPKHRRPRSRARIAAAACALPLAAAALIAPTMSANAAAPASLSISDTSGWVNDWIVMPLGCAAPPSYTINGGAPVSGVAGKRTLVFATYPNTESTTVVVTCDAKTYSYTFETKQTYQALAAAQEPQLIDKPGPIDDAIVLSALPGVAWNVQVGAGAPVDYLPVDFGTAKTKSISVSGATSVTVKASPVDGFTLVKGLTPYGSSWTFTVNPGAAALTIPVTSEPKFLDADGTSADAVTLTNIPGVTWKITGDISAKDIGAADFGSQKTLTIKLSTLSPSNTTPSVSVLADGGSTYATTKAGGGAANYGATYSYSPTAVSIGSPTPGLGPVAIDDQPGTSKDSLTITSPSAGLIWKVNGVEVKTTKDKPVKVTVKTAAAGSTVKVTAELKPGGDYTFTGGNANGFDTGNNYSFAGNAVATLTAPTRSAGADTVALTGNDGATYTIAGTTLAVPTGLVKTVVVPGSTGQQIVVVAKPKAGYSLTNAAADGSLTWALAP